MRTPYLVVGIALILIGLLIGGSTLWVVSDGARLGMAEAILPIGACILVGSGIVLILLWRRQGMPRDNDGTQP